MSCGTCFSSCARCSSSGICEECIISIHRPALDGMSCNLCNIAGCANCNTPGVCVKCEGNGFLAFNGFTCSDCPSFCQECSAPSKCKTCANMYEKPDLGGNFCHLCRITSCERCSAKNVCVSCSAGLVPYYDGSKCINPSSCPSYCAKCDHTKACVQCADPTKKPTIHGNQCYKCLGQYC